MRQQRFPSTKIHSSSIQRQPAAAVLSHVLPLQVVAIANDITFSSGAFGPKEDAVFRAVTEFALEERLPIVYLAANSGARVGLANELKKAFKVCACLAFSFVARFAMEGAVVVISRQLLVEDPSLCLCLRSCHQEPSPK